MSYTLFIDESGSISLNNGEKYFCIGGYLVEQGNEKHKFKMKKIIKNVMKNKNDFFNYYAKRDKQTEVKFSNLSFAGKNYVLQELNELKNEGGIFVSIIVDKENCFSLVNSDTNEYYNYLVGLLIEYVFETCNYAGTIDFDELKIIYDDRSMKVKARNGLQAYLIEKFKINREESKQFSCNFNIKAANSKSNYGVMVSDLVAGTCKDFYTRDNDELFKILDIDYVSKFPYKQFKSKNIINKVVDNKHSKSYNIINS